MTIFRFKSADGLTNVEFTTDLIGFSEGSDNLTICQVNDMVGGTPNQITQDLLNTFDRNKHSVSELKSYAIAQSLTLEAYEQGRETESNGYVSANAATLATPTGFTATVNSATQITLNWTKSPGATGYVVTRSTQADFSSGNTSFTLGDVATKVDTGLTTATHYYYRLKAFKAGFTDSGYALDNKTTS